MSYLQPITDSLTQFIDTASNIVTQVAHNSESTNVGHLAPLISDLALILIVAAAVTLLFRKLKQPLVLGYIIAGFLVGPYFKYSPTVVDLENVKTLAEIGVIFLLFSLGLEFSFKKLVRVGGAASITAVVEIIFITVAGYFLGKFLGWSTIDCLFLGGMLASSSTTIILKTFDDLGVKSKGFARIVFGVLVVEDIIVILLMVLLSTVAVTQHFQGSEMLFTIGKLLFFLVLWFLMGIFIIPTLLKKIKNLLDEETYLVLSIGLCLTMVVIATQVGFSAELGAFIMGSILAETTSAEKIEHVTLPVKNLFGAIFFVSVGMMIDPSVIVEYGWIVLAVTLLTIFGKLFSSILGALLSGQPLKQAVEVGMSMAQIGEFAFIVATLGMSLGVISDFLFPVAVGASAITTFTTPYMIKYSDNFYGFLCKILPKKLQKAIDSYSATTQTIQAESEWKNFYKRTLSLTLVNGIIVLAIMALGVHLLLPALQNVIPSDVLARILSFVISIAVSFPFLWAILFKRLNNMNYQELWKNNNYKNGPLFILESFRILIGMLLLVYLVHSIFSTYTSLFIIIPILIGLFLIFSKKIHNVYSHIEGRFVSNLNSREQAEAENKNINNTIYKDYFSTWDIHLCDLQVYQDAEYVGRTLAELNWREKYGISVVYIKRGDTLIYAPGPHSKILPFDHLGIIATDEQMKHFRPAFETKEILNGENYDVNDIIIERFIINENNPLKDTSIKDSKIRENINGMIIGVERDNQRIANPSADTILQEHDIVWIVGEKKQLKKLKD